MAQMVLQNKMKPLKSKTVVMPTERVTAEKEMPDFGNLGMRVRSLRISKGLSLRQLSRLAGCSPSFVSMLEQDHLSPSVTSLQKICRALKMPIGDVLREPPQIEEPHLIDLQSTQNPLAMRWQHALLRHVLPKQGAQQFTMMTLTLDPGGETPVRHCRRSINSVSVVLDGTIQMKIRDKSFRLDKMKAIYFDLSAPHQWINVGEGPAQILRVHPYMFHLFEQEEEDLSYLRAKKKRSG
jgi:transcriptional regulator with XRE-family HTH domain